MNQQKGFSELINTKEMTTMTNREICQFVNSKDIRKHLLDIEYKFSALEAAWLVYQCFALTLEERINAWEDIIATMPDQKADSPHFDKPYESTHAVLKEYIEIRKRTLDMMLKEDVKAFYHYSISYKTNYANYEDNVAYSSYEKCLHELKKELADCSEDEIHFGRIVRTEIDGTYPITAYYNSKGLIKDVEIHPDYGVFNWNITDFFDDLWFHFPVPFKKGDVLYNPIYPNKFDCAGPVVMTGITPLYYEEDHRRHADTSDMIVSGYFQCEDGTIYHEVTYNYMDYEYFPAESLTGKKRILKSLSSFEKGEISIDLFIKAYHLIILEETVNELTPKGWYTDEGMKLAGLLE